jgi:hypothetical protein
MSALLDNKDQNEQGDQDSQEVSQEPGDRHGMLEKILHGVTSMDPDRLFF